MSRFGSSTKQLFMCTPWVHRPNVTGKADAGKQFTWRQLRKWGNSGRSFVLSLFISWPWERVSYWSRTYFFIYWLLPAHRSFGPVSLASGLSCNSSCPSEKRTKQKPISLIRQNKQTTNSKCGSPEMQVSNNWTSSPLFEICHFHWSSLISQQLERILSGR